MSTDAFNVASAMGSFTTHVIEGLAMTASTRDEDGTYHWIPLSIVSNEGTGGHELSSPIWPQRETQTPDKQAAAARAAALADKLRRLPVDKSRSPYC